MTAPIPPLFGGPIRGSVVAPTVSSGPIHLVEFRAGRMTLRDRLVTPDRRKGLVYVFQSDDGLAHFCWKDRTSGTVEEDLLVFPDDCDFQKVSAEKTRGGRVFLLRFKSNPSRKFFFWSQESRADQDDQLCEKVMEAINNPGQVLAGIMASRSSGDGSAATRGSGTESLLPTGGVSPLGGTFTEADLQALLGAYSPQQLLSWMNSGANSRPTSAGLGSTTPFGIGAASNNNNSQTSAPSTNATATPASANSAKNTSAASLGPSDLAAALRAIGATMSQTKTGSAAVNNEANAVPLSDILAADAVINSATAPGTAIDRLIAHLPQGTGLQEDEELLASLRSPQFQQAANMLSAALETGQLGPLLVEMGVAREAVAGVHDVETFLRALQQHHASVPSTPATNGSTNGVTKSVPPGAPKKEATDQTNGSGKNGKKDANGDNGADNGSSPMEH